MALVTHEGVVLSLFYNLPILENVDAIRVLDGGESFIRIYT